MGSSYMGRPNSPCKIMMFPSFRRHCTLHGGSSSGRGSFLCFFFIDDKDLNLPWNKTSLFSPFYGLLKCQVAGFDRKALGAYFLHGYSV